MFGIEGQTPVIGRGSLFHVARIARSIRPGRPVTRKLGGGVFKGTRLRERFVVPTDRSERYDKVEPEFYAVRDELDRLAKQFDCAVRTAMLKRLRARGIVELGVLRISEYGLLYDAIRSFLITLRRRLPCKRQIFERNARHRSRSHPVIAILPTGAKGGT